MLAQHRGPFALAPESPDPGRSGDDRWRHDPRSRPSRQCRRQNRRRDARRMSRRSRRGGYPAQHLVRGRRADRDRQAEGAGGASGRRKPHRHAGQRADRALRRKPFGDRRGEAPRHRAPARQGYDRRDGGGEDRPRAPQRSRPNSPTTAAPARWNAPISPSSGACQTAQRHDRRPARPPPQGARQAGCPRRAAARRSPTGSCWKNTPASTANRSRACLSCRLETGRTHQIRVHLAHIGHPLLGDATYGPGFKTKAALLRRTARQAARGPWQAGPACPYAGLPTPRNRRAS